MASSPRDVEREEERRLNMRTLTIASAASAAAAAVTSQLWIAGTWIAAALTPVLVALISEALHKPTERVAAWTSERGVRPSVAGRRMRGAPQPDADPLPRRAPPEPLAGAAGPVRVYRQGRPAPLRRKHLAIGVVAATGAIAFVIGILTLTTVDLVSGGSVGKGSGRTSLFSDSKPDENGKDGTEETAPADRERQDETRDQPSGDSETPDQTTEPQQDEPPSDTETAPPPDDAPPGEPLPDALP
jgi:hypothetical protein